MSTRGGSSGRTVLTASLSVVFLTALGAAECRAERLPTTFYTTADGLAHNGVQRILADTRGFIWLATREGLSRFDGYTFANYGVEHGLPGRVVNDVLETRDGIYLVATASGLARLEVADYEGAGARPGSGAALFSVHRAAGNAEAHHVNTLYQTRDGRVWAGTRKGLFELEDVARSLRWRAVALNAPPTSAAQRVLSIREDRFGTIWLGTPTGLRRVWPDGRVDAHLPDIGIHTILIDQNGTVWAGTRLSGLIAFTLDKEGQVSGVSAYTQKSDGLPADWISDLFEADKGTLWAASPAGIIQVAVGLAGERRFRLLGEAHGLGPGDLEAFARDRHGNVWVGTSHSGVIKIVRSGFTTFGAADGIRWSASLVQSRSGPPCLVGEVPVSGWGLLCFDGRAWQPVRPAFGNSGGAMSWGWHQLVMQDHSGEWWFATRDGVARFAGAPAPRDLDRRSPTSWLRWRERSAATVVLALFEDSRGDVWLATSGEGGRNGLGRWERKTGTLHHFGAERHLPDLQAFFPTAFAEDASGSVWIGFSGRGGIARYRDGSFHPLATRDVFRGMVRAIASDSKGRLWAASTGGLVRIEQPASDSPAFTLFGPGDGLSSGEHTAIVEDSHGRMYIATGRGLDRFEPDTGRIKHFSSRDGVPLGAFTSALRDPRTGHLWFTHRTGATRLIPPPEPAPAAPPIHIAGIRIAEEPQPLHPLGELTARQLTLRHDRNDLRIDFVGLGFAPGEELRYEYLLEGAQTRWSAPSPERAVTFVNVRPGNYRFLVRAVSADGVASTQPASVAFTVLPPIWQRSWFLAIVAAGTLAAAYAIYRRRLARVVEIATLRTRIATDLHDDIGANLTKIAILSEVARQEMDGRPGAPIERLVAIAQISRESVASMSDVVWAINPRRDTLLDTVRRMRQHAEELLADGRIALDFRAPAADGVVRLPIHVRRGLLLVFKEALHNAVRHSDCRAIVVQIRLTDAVLQLEVADDGRGFDLASAAGGNGLASMHRRAADLNGSLTIGTAPGRGTTVLLLVRGPFRLHSGGPA